MCSIYVEREAESPANELHNLCTVQLSQKATLRDYMIANIEWLVHVVQHDVRILKV